MIIYQEFLAMNEEMASFDPSERLRYAVHEIMYGMKDSDQITFIELSKRLKDEFKIDIDSKILKTIFENWDRFNNPDYSVFKKDDKTWMDVFPYQNYVKRKSKDKQSFGKHRKKETTNYSNANQYYPNNMSGYYDNTGKWISYNRKYYEQWD